MNLSQAVGQLLFGLELVFFVFLGFSALYIFVFAFIGLFYREKKMSRPGAGNKIAVLIPGYKEDSVIIEVAKDALRQNYPTNRFDVIVIADSFQPKTLKKLAKLPIKLMEVSFETSTKAKSINTTLAKLPEHYYDIVVVLDSDNIMKSNFLKKVDQAYTNGYRAIQGHRAAKNKNTTFALLDAANEEINNHIFRKGHWAAGLSSALIGSAMAFDYSMFKRMMSTIGDVAGEDKELEVRLLKEKIKIIYLDSAYVLDEKVQHAEVFANQRKRWIATQIHYVRQYFFKGISEMLKGNFDYFNKAIQAIVMPRILLLGVLTLVIALLLFIPNYIPDALWAGLLLCTCLALLMGLPKKFYNKKMLNAALSIPKSFFFMIVALTKIKGAHKKFIHTPHTVSGSESED